MTGRFSNAVGHLSHVPISADVKLRSCVPVHIALLFRTKGNEARPRWRSHVQSQRRTRMALLLLPIVVLGACGRSGSTASSSPAAAGTAGAAGAVSGAAGAASTTGGVEGSGTGPLIAFSQEGLENSWRSENTNSILSEAKKAGYRIVWQQADGDQSKQVAQVQNLLQQKPALLIVEPAEQQAATPIAGLAQKAGVPLIVADRALGVAPGSNATYKTLITQDWTKVGVALGEAAVKTLQAKSGKAEGNIVELAGVLGSSPQIAMDAGFKSVIAKSPGIKIVASQDGNNERGPGLRIMEDYLTRYPKGQISLVWAQNDEMGVGALKAIQSAGRTELLGSILAKDGQLEGIQQVADGNFAADCSNTPYFGPIIMPYAKDILAGKQVAKAPDKPFTCYESITAQGKADAKKALDTMNSTKAQFANR